MPNKIIANPDTFRVSIREQLNILLKDEKLALNLEKGILNWSLKEASQRKVVKKWDNPYFTTIYIDHLKSIYINLKKNMGLIEQMKMNSIKPHIIAFMTHQEIQPDKWNSLIEKKTKRDASKCDKKVGASTAMFTCSRCKSKNCTYYEMQTRSADEPATIFITCLNCDKHWRN